MDDNTLDQYLDGELTDAERSQLNQWLEQDPAHVEMLAERAFLHAELRRRLLRKAIEQDVLAPTNEHAVRSVDTNTLPYRRIKRRLATFARYGVVSLSVVALTLIGQQIFDPRPELIAPIGSAPAPAVERKRPLEYVATLRRSMDCQWETPALPFVAGQRLVPGTLILEQGVAEIAFDTGANLTLEGPATIRIIGRSAAQLLAGKLVFKGDETSIFDLSTPDVQLVDIGTEYAVSVGPDSEELHVFEGEVLRSDKLGAIDRLFAGEAKRYSTGTAGAGSSISLATDDFVRQVPDMVPPIREADSLLAFEDFSYRDPMAINSGQANGGSGWTGSWEIGKRFTAGKFQNIALINPDTSIAAKGAPPQRAGVLEFPSAATGISDAGIHRRLATPLRLDQDGVYYFSCQFEFGNQPASVADDPYAFMFILRPDFSRDVRQQRRMSEREEVAVGVHSSSHGIAVIFQETGKRTAVPLPTGRPYLLVGKIVCSRDLSDQVLVRVFGREEELTSLEPQDWTLVGHEALATRDLAIATLHIDPQQYEQRFDELRIGRTWASVTASMSQSP